MIAVLGLCGSAEAACALRGKWHIGFAAGNADHDAALDCKVTIKANGTYSGACVAYTSGEAKTQGTVTGRLRANSACVVTGSFKPSGRPGTVFRTGFLSGPHGYVVGTRGDINAPNQVRLGILIKG
jgi:hypothetical protein